ncbi:MAG: hypothetical protein MMC33_010129 [Icmadophila ericetorum]|nr:hypothetical protein [Icmadophila ericetorum]
MRPIEMMANIYRHSTVTLVYDAGLQSYSYDDQIPMATFVLRFFTCKWMHRLWTLYECVLAQNIVVAFREALVPIKDIFVRAMRNLMYPVANHVWDDLIILTTYGRSNNLAMGALQRLLLSRKCSNPDDEPFVTAPLLGIAPGAITASSHEERMVKFWSCVGKVSSGTMFSTCNRLETMGFGWAPKSLAGNQQDVRMAPGKSTAEVTPLGLRHEGLLFKFKSPVHFDGEIALLCDSLDDHFFLMTRDSADHEKLKSLNQYDAIVALNNPRFSITTGVILQLTAEAPVPRYSYSLRVASMGFPEANERLRRHAIMCRSEEKEIVIA